MRSSSDNELTIEEILEGDNQNDNFSDNSSDNLKTLPNKEGDNGDNLDLDKKKSKNNFSPPYDNPPSVMHKKEVIDNISFDPTEVVTPVTNQAQQEFEPVTEPVTEAVTSPIDWQSYPYQSKDTLTLKNRAKKVKERVLSCTTNNELIALHAEGKVSQAEIDWLMSHLLTTVECQQLEAAEKTRQPNLFKENASHKVKEQITFEVKRIGWSKKKAIEYISAKYSVTSRQEMSVEQLIEFRDYLTGLPK